MMHSARKTQCGFTLVEMIVVMVITGIIGGMVAIFIRAPVQGYMDSSRRAEMSDIADTALRRLGRDIRTAVPNSVRLPAPAGSTYIEFLPTKDGGRYRAAPATTGALACGSYAGAVLDFSTTDTCFEIIGAGIQLTKHATDEDKSDQIVIGSTQSSGDAPYIKTFAGNGVRRPYTGVTGTQTAVLITGEQFPAFAEVQGQRFDVVPGDQQAVTYACVGPLVALNPNTNDGQAQLMRYWSYGFQAGQQTPAAIAAAANTRAILADRVSNCVITYDRVNQRNGLVSILLEITRSGERISLYHTIHVNNMP